MTVENLRSGSIATRIKNLTQEATNLKTSQFTGWDSIRCYKIETTNAYDYEFNFSSPTSFNYSYIQVKYTADYQNAPFAKLIADILLDDDGISYRKTIDPGGSSPYVFVGENPSRKTFFSTDPTNPKELFWTVQINSSSITNVKVKLRVFATQPGRIMAGAQINDSFNGEVFIE